MNPTAIRTTYLGLILIPYVSSSKNLISPAPVTGIVSFLFLGSFLFLTLDKTSPNIKNNIVNKFNLNVDTINLSPNFINLLYVTLNLIILFKI